MPSSLSYSQLETGPGRIHVDVVSAAAELFNSGASAVVANFATIIAQQLASPASKTYTAAGGGDATRVMAAPDGPFYVGDDVSDDLKDLFMVVDSATDAQIFNPHTRLYVTVASISATVGSGFSTSALTLTFNTPVPGSLSYKVYYGRRSTLGSLPVELASNPVIRRSADRVRFPEFDRTGYAPTSISIDIDYTGLEGYPDPYLAQWKAKLVGATSATIDHGRSGAMGFVHVGSKQNVADVNDTVLRNVAAAAFFAAVEKDIRTTTFTLGNVPYTKINSTLQAAVVTTNKIVLNAADYFRQTGPDRTSIRIGTDMLEVTFSSGYKAVYIPVTFDVSDVRTVTVVTLGGDNPNLPSDSNVRVKWIRPTFYAGSYENDASGFELKGQGSLVAGAITNNPSQELQQTAPFFSAGTLDPARADSGNNNWNIKALNWGAYTETGAGTTVIGRKTVLGELWGDGSVQSYGGRIKGMFANRARNLAINPGAQGDNIDPRAASLVRYDFIFSGSKQLTLTLDPTYTPQEGDKIMIMIVHTFDGASRTDSVITWPTDWRFSGTDADIRTTLPSGVVPYMKFEGTYVEGFCFFTRTDYAV